MQGGWGPSRPGGEVNIPSRNVVFGESVLDSQQAKEEQPVTSWMDLHKLEPQPQPSFSPPYSPALLANCRTTFTSSPSIPAANNMVYNPPGFRSQWTHLQVNPSGFIHMFP